MIQKMDLSALAEASSSSTQHAPSTDIRQDSSVTAALEVGSGDEVAGVGGVVVPPRKWHMITMATGFIFILVQVSSTKLKLTLHFQGIFLIFGENCFQEVISHDN